MSQQFLSQVLKVENEIVEPLVATLLQAQSDSSQPCCICLQDIGTLSTETGVIECEVRLPCSHLVGSACIATWLRTNNTCPVCRRVFFPAERGLFLEWDPWEEDQLMTYEGEPATAVWPPVEAGIAFLCDTYCRELGLSSNTQNIAEQVAEELDRSVDLEDHRLRLIVSATLYMVTHIMGDHRSLEEISRVSDIQAENIRQAYRCIYPTREQLIRPHMLGGLDGHIIQDFFKDLPAPNAENGFIDYEESGSDLEHHLIRGYPEQLEELCSHCGDELGYVRSVLNICPQIAGKIRAGSYLAGLSPLPIVAVSLFMTSQVMGFDTPIKLISGVVGISEGAIRNAYRSLYSRRDELFNYDMLSEIRRQIFLQDLVWPAI